MLAFQFGRYLLAASSRPGTQAANLQGIWNHHVTPPWNCDYTTNINVEMNYWPAETCALPEFHEPLFDLVEDLSRTGVETARRLYDAGGWCCHHNTDYWRLTTPVNGRACWQAWPMAGSGSRCTSPSAGASAATRSSSPRGSRSPWARPGSRSTASPRARTGRS